MSSTRTSSAGPDLDGGGGAAHVHPVSEGGIAGRARGFERAVVGGQRGGKLALLEEDERFLAGRFGGGAEGLSHLSSPSAVGPRLVGLHPLERDELAHFAARLLREGRPVARERRLVERGGRSRPPSGAGASETPAESAEGSSKKWLMDSSNT